MNGAAPYLLRKLAKLIRNRIWLGRFQTRPGLYCFRRSSAPPASIGFDFSDERYVHIGDQLFFEPIVRACSAAGVDVVVAPSAPMQEYFRLAGHRIGDRDAVLGQELRVSSLWMFDSITAGVRRDRFVYLDPSAHGMDAPVTDYLTASLFEMANLRTGFKPGDLVPYRVSPSCPLNELLPERTIVFNDAVDSGSFRVLPAHRTRLVEAARLAVGGGYALVRVGTKPELDSRPGGLPLDHIDLRGRTSVAELMSVIGSERVAGTISFDTAIAHIGLLYGKPVQVCLRSFTRRHQAHVRQHIFPSYRSEMEPAITFI